MHQVMPALLTAESCSEDVMNNMCLVLQGLAGHLPPLELQSIPSIVPELQGAVAAVAGAHPWQSDLHGEPPAADLCLEGTIFSVAFPSLSER